MIVVLGSINLDLVARVPRFGQPGETRVAESFAMHPGGKGANQALAAARAGARVTMAGAVGRDAFAAPALAGLRAGGVDVGAVRAVAGPTGLALIEVAASGENRILIVAGANAHADASDVRADWLGPSTWSFCSRRFRRPPTWRSPCVPGPQARGLCSTPHRHARWSPRCSIASASWS